MQLSKKALMAKPSSTLAITAKAREMAAAGIDIVGFGAGEPDFDTPDFVKKAAIDAINSGFTKYTPSSGTVELRKAICDKLERDNGLKYSPNQIVVSNGAKHSLSNIFQAILNEGDEVIILAPFWLSYPEMVNVYGGVSVIVHCASENNFVVTKEQLENALTSKTKAIIINSPSNPSGAIYKKEELQVVADFAVKNDLFVISDEIYENLTYDNQTHVSIASLNDEIFKRTIVVNGFSKSYSMTGWRIGYTASSQEIADVMGNVQSHCASNPNSIAQKAATAAYTEQNSFVKDMCKEFEKRRDFIYEKACNIPLISATKPGGAFYLFIDISNLCGKTIDGVLINDATDITSILLSKYNIAVVPGNDFGYPKHIRLSYAISMENIKKGMESLERFVLENYK